jgi:hypothetical protein
MQESCTYGSVRGAPSNGRPYRNHHDDQVRLPRDHLIDRHHPISRRGLTCPIGEYVDATGDLGQLRNASDPRDQWIVPLLEEYFRPLRQTIRAASGLNETRLKPGGKLLRPFACLYHGANHPNHVADARDASLIEGMDVQPVANKLGGDICLEIGKSQDEIGAQGEDLVDVR